MNKIMVVDDDAINLKHITINLIRNFEYDVITANNAKSALDIASHERVSLFIIDWCMPEMSGLELLIELKKYEMYKATPVIITSGQMIDSTHLNTALSLGAIDFIKKPFDDTEFVSRVSNMIQANAYCESLLSRNTQLQNQLAAKITAIQHFYESVRVLKKKFDDLKLELTRQQVELPEDLIRMIDSMLSAEELEWEEFQSDFEFVHRDFFKRLRRLYPDLTNTELRLCAFLRLNMTNKAIAKVICISPDSVNTSRKRLKKKLAIDANDSLVEFLAKI